MLIERVIKVLTDRGYRIAAVKQSDHAIETDRVGKDSNRFGMAGANPVVLSAVDTTTYFFRTAQNFQTILETLQVAYLIDLLIVEGAWEPEIEKIRVGEIPLREKTIWTYDGDFDKLIKHIIQEVYHVSNKDCC